MPRGDGTGPMGLGPMTGRGTGYCAGYPYPGFMNPGFRRGYFGWGRGRGWRNWYPTTEIPNQERATYRLSPWGRYPNQPDKKEEKEMLNEELKSLKEGITAIEKRLQDLKGQKK
jgi:hypothetical protein